MKFNEMWVASHNICWPKQEICGRWILFSLRAEEVRQGVYMVSLKSGFRVVHSDYIDVDEIEKVLKSMKPTDISVEWTKYLVDCSITGTDPLCVLPPPETSEIQYKITLRKISNEIYIADDNCPVEVQHHLQAFQSPSGLRVSDAWRKYFEIGSDKLLITVSVKPRPTFECRASWYRALKDSVDGGSRRRQPVKRRRVSNNFTHHTAIF